MSDSPDAADRLFHEVGRFNADYARVIDDAGGAGWADLFAEDCLYSITTADNHRRGLPAGLVYAVGRGMLHDRITALNEANIYEQHTYRHLLGQPGIGEVQGGEIVAETSFLVVRIMRTGETTLFASGRYLDRFVRDVGRLVLRQRIAVCDSNRIDTLLALPL